MILAFNRDPTARVALRWDARYRKHPAHESLCARGKDALFESRVSKPAHSELLGLRGPELLGLPGVDTPHNATNDAMPLTDTRSSKRVT